LSCPRKSAATEQVATAEITQPQAASGMRAIIGRNFTSHIKRMRLHDFSSGTNGRTVTGFLNCFSFGLVKFK
jgi:hypothetical protein